MFLEPSTAYREIGVYIGLLLYCIICGIGPPRVMVKYVHISRAFPEGRSTGAPLIYCSGGGGGDKMSHEIGRMRQSILELTKIRIKHWARKMLR